jgi:hypothetical protein
MSNSFPREQNFSQSIIERNVISRYEVGICIQEIEQGIRDAKVGHIIKVRCELTEIDILLVAYLVLYRISNPTFTFELWLNHANSEGAIYRKIEQYRMHASYAAKGNIFGIWFWDGQDASEVIPEGQRFSDEELGGLSSTFAPILIITRDTIDSLFFSAFKQDSLSGFVEPEFVNNNERLRILYSSAWLSILRTAKGFNEGKTSALAIPAFWRSLEAAKILNFYLCKENKELFDTCTYGQFSHETFLGHFKALETVFAKLESKPPIFHFVYYLLLSSDLLPNEITRVALSDFQRKVKNLWNFTVRLIAGLSELARNITQHSSDKKGAITLRLYDRKQFAELFEVETSDSWNGLSVIKKASAVFDINVVDLGTRGVVPTLADSVRQSISDEDNEILRSSFAADQDRLDNGKVSLSHLLDTKGGIHLDHQAKRAVAHLGLQIFSKIIDENHGIIRASSWSGPQSRDNAPPIVQDGGDGPVVQTGTNFNILLPIDADREYGTQLPDIIPSPSESTRAEMLSLDDFFMLPITAIPKPDEGDMNPEPYNLRKSCVTYRLHPKVLDDRATERTLWNDFYISCHLLFRQAKFRALDFDRIKGLSASNLFRFLGRWELEFSGKSLIIFNVPNDIFLELVMINDEYTSRLNAGIPPYEKPVPYWNRNTMQLIYSYVEGDIDLRFHFSDALWGENKRHFAAVNKMIRNTNFNSVTLIENGDFTENIENPVLNVADLLREFDLFYDGVALLPFDLLLKSAAGTSLFEQNAQSLLMNELRVD